MSKGDSLAEILQDEYLSQIRKALPLHRLIVFVVSVTLIVQTKVMEYKSVTEGFLKSSVTSFFSFDDGYFSSLIVQDALLAVGVLVLGYLLHLLLLKLMFAIIRKHLQLDHIASKLTERSGEVGDSTIYTYLSLKRSELEASKYKNKISHLSSISEIAASLSILFIYAFYFGNAIDGMISAVLLVASIYIQQKAFKVFLQNYLPHDAHIRGVLGDRNKAELP